MLILWASAAGAQSSAPSTTSNGVRTLLSWLDDAEVLAPAHVEVSTAWTRLDRQASREIDFPSVFAAVGVVPRLQVATSAFRYSSSYADGSTSSGSGDGWIIAKVAVISPRAHPGGIAISPLVEILSDASVASRAVGSGRVAWGLPVNLQYTWTKVQILGTAAYFSRGALTADAGIQAWVAGNTIASVSLLHSHATAHTTLDDQYGLLQDRTDATVSIDVFVKPNVTLFGTVGRTLGTLDASGTTSQVSLGLSLSFAPRTGP
jgi:hypothetical protein